MAERPSCLSVPRRRQGWPGAGHRGPNRNKPRRCQSADLRTHHGPALPCRGPGRHAHARHYEAWAPRHCAGLSCAARRGRSGAECVVQRNDGAGGPGAGDQSARSSETVRVSEGPRRNGQDQDCGRRRRPHQGRAGISRLQADRRADRTSRQSGAGGSGISLCEKPPCSEGSFVTLLAYVFLFAASVVVTLGACALFTNAIEWLGKRRNLSEGAVGRLTAGIGTTLPETSIPIVAIFFGATREEAEVGLGAILGAPFMLSTLVVPMLAILLMIYTRLGKRGPSFHLKYKDVSLDLSCFALAYMVAMGCAFVPSQMLRLVAALGL